MSTFDENSTVPRDEGLALICEAGHGVASHEELFKNLTTAVNAVLCGDGTFLQLLSADYGTLKRFGPIPEATEWSDEMPTGIGRLRWLFEAKEPIIMDYTRPHIKDRIPKFALEHGYLSAISIPIVADGSTFGICSTRYKRAITWERDDISYLKICGRVLGSLVSSAMTENKHISLALLEERKRLSSEIHDNVSHLVGSLSLCSASILASYEEGDMDFVERGLEKMEALCGKTIRVFRDEMLSLRVPLDRTNEWTESIIPILSNFESEWGIKTTLEQDIANEPLSLNVITSMHLSRILRECLSNVVRHAQASRVVVSLHEDDSNLLMTVTDDGCGFDVDAVSLARFGIKIMHERADAIGGKLTIVSSEDGTAVRVYVPRIGKW